MIAAVTVAVGALCIVAAVLIATVGQMQWPRTVVALVLTGATGILNSTIGAKIHGGINDANGWSGHFLGKWTGGLILTILGLAVLTYAGFRVLRNRIDNRTLVATALVPPAVTVIPGALGSALVAIVGVIPLTIAFIIGHLFGIR